MFMFTLDEMKFRDFFHFLFIFFQIYTLNRQTKNIQVYKLDKNVQKIYNQVIQKSQIDKKNCLIKIPPEKIPMLSVKQEKHLLYFDKQKKCFSSFVFEVKEKDDGSDKKEKSRDTSLNDSTQINGLLLSTGFGLAEIVKFTATMRIENSFTYKWESEYYDLKQQQHWGEMPKLHKIPLSLETYFSLYKNPQQWKVSFTLKPKYSDPNKFDQKQILSKILKHDCIVGKLIVTTSFSHVRKNQPFKIPLNLLQQKDLNLQAKKTIKIIAQNDDEMVICSGSLVSEEICEKVPNFNCQGMMTNQYKVWTFAVNPRVNTENICVLKHYFNELKFQFNKIIIRILSPQQPQFIPTLSKLFQSLRPMLQIQPLTIVQNIPTTLQSFHSIVFYTDLITLPQRIFRSYLYDKIQDKWLIEGMVSYSRSNKQFQDCMSQLIQLMNQGQEFFPLVNDNYHFDQVWKAKARFFFYVLANFKTTRDYGSSTLVGLVLELAEKKKITSTYLFRKLKNKYGLQGSFRSIYQQQFIKSTGLNRIFYQLIDIRRDNSVKFIVRQKSLLNKFFKTYNLFRIKLEQAYGEVSPMMERIIKKNKYEDMAKRKDLPGPLAVPEFIRCLPYFRGKMTVQSDACQPFQLQLLEQNIIQKTKLSSSLRARPAARKPGQVDKGIDGFTWMMIDTAYIFPAVYKNENVQENVILERIKKIYESEQEEIKVLNCISSTNHSQNQQICKALLQKLKMQPKTLNTTLSVKRKILQIIPIFINKLKDSTIWQDYYALFQLYQPPCYDYSDDGYQFLTSLIQSSTTLIYKKQFSFYFNELHRILLSILLNHQILASEEKELRLRNLLYKSLMKWRSKYSFEILKHIVDTLEMLALNVGNNLISIKVIIQNLLRFLDQIQKNSLGKTQLIQTTHHLIHKCITHDHTGQLYATQFHYSLLKHQQSLPTIDFLRFAFHKLQQLEKNYHEKQQHYYLCLKYFKNVIQMNKMRYGLKVQLDELNQDQGYFLAEYMWGKLASRVALTDARIRLQWLKIYRIFYFYFTPIITLYKLRKALKSSQTNQFSMTTTQIQQLLSNCAQLSFVPDIRWMSGYDSSAAKEQKAKYQQYNLENNRRKRKFEQLSFQQNNIITRFIKQNPGKDSWQDITRQALRIIILIEEKKEVDNPEQADRFKKIVQGLKGVQNFLKRGNMPNDYSFDKVRMQAQYVLRQFDEDTEKMEEIFLMVSAALESIKEQRRQKEIEKENEMKIFIPKDWMAIEDEDIMGAGEGMGNILLSAIKEYPQEQGDEDERQMMRKIVQEDDEKGDGQEIEMDGLGVQRYSSIFEE